jgi:hypothetical protein
MSHLRYWQSRHRSRRTFRCLRGGRATHEPLVANWRQEGPLKVFAEVRGLEGVDSARSGSFRLLYFLLYFRRAWKPAQETAGRHSQLSDRAGHKIVLPLPNGHLPAP